MAIVAEEEEEVIICHAETNIFTNLKMKIVANNFVN